MNPGSPGSGRSDHHIAIWGALASGKTTFLAALSVALIDKQGPWRVIGDDPASTDFLSDMTSKLSDRREFPPATQTQVRYRWSLIGRPERRRGLLGLGRKTVPASRIGLDVLDVPGGHYLNRPRPGVDRDALLKDLERSRGIVFLFDPIQEYTDGEAFAHLHGVLNELAARMLGSGEFEDGMLPHYLAVCITKFDEPRVLQTASELGLAYPGEAYEFPRVDDGADAEQLLKALCTIAPNGTARRVIPALKQFFHEDRIMYFVSSSIGFYLPPYQEVFDPDDFQNLSVESVPGSGKKVHRIRGDVHPINVMEPIVWLGQRLADQNG